MTITTIVTISHEELHSLGLSDEDFRNLGYRLKEATSWGKTYEKIAWQNAVPEYVKEL